MVIHFDTAAARQVALRNSSRLRYAGGPHAAKLSSVFLRPALTQAELERKRELYARHGDALRTAQRQGRLRWDGAVPLVRPEGGGGWAPMVPPSNPSGSGAST